MNRNKIVNLFSRLYLFVSAASFLMVGLMAFNNPQAVMDLVHVQLTNNDAFSSIRGVYGGVGLTISVMLIRWGIRDVKQGIVFLCLLWGLYAVSRLVTIMAEGPLGAFGTQWLVIESVFFIWGISLLLLRRNN